MTRSNDPDPDITPGLEPGGGVPPGSTPPETPQTSGLSEPEPATRRHFPVVGSITLVVVPMLALIFLVVGIALLSRVF